MELNPVVLIIDSTARVQRYRQWLEESCVVRTASNRSAALSAVDDEVCIIVLRHELKEELKSKVASQAEAQSPCRLAVTTSKETEILYPDIDCDLTASEPITKQLLRDIVDSLYKRGLYEDRLRKYYQLSLQMANDSGTGHTAEGEDAHEQRQKRLDQLKDVLDKIKRSLDADDIDAVLADIQSGHSMPVSDEQSTVNQGDYVPEECQECGLSWNEMHGDTLGAGYEKVGAFTWRCTGCRTVQSIPVPTNQSVARRTK